MISISPAVNWYASFSRSGGGVKLPVAYFESRTEGVEPDVIVYRGAMVFDPRSKRLVDALVLASFVRLSYEPSKKVDRQVNMAKLKSFLSNVGVENATKEIDSEVASFVKKELGAQRATEIMDTLEDRDEL